MTDTLHTAVPLINTQTRKCKVRKCKQLLGDMSVVYKPGVTERTHERQLFTVCLSYICGGYHKGLSIAKATKKAGTDFTLACTVPKN